MTLIVDAAPLIALADEGDSRRLDVADALMRERGPLVIPAPVTAEADYMLRTRLGRVASRALLADIAAGRFDVVGLTRDEHALAIEIDARYDALDLGLSDAAVIALAHRFGTYRILTFDERHFRAVTAFDGTPFTLLPTDER